MGLEIVDSSLDHAEENSGRYWLQLTQSILNMIAFLLIGIVVGVCVAFVFNLDMTPNAFYRHILLCVLGYQLLMGVAILSLTSNSGFSASISLRHKRLFHTILQVIGSALAIAGSITMSLTKVVNFDTAHGITALVAMVFTTVSLVNGLTSLYAYELRNYLPGTLSKLTHICFGTIAFIMASVSLCFGFEKNSFRTWSNYEFTIVLTVFVGIFTVICIINPLITFFSRLNNAIKN